MLDFMHLGIPLSLNQDIMLQFIIIRIFYPIVKRKIGFLCGDFQDFHSSVNRRIASESDLFIVSTYGNRNEYRSRIP